MENRNVEKRRTPRVEAKNLVAYEHFSSSGTPLQQAMGWTLNISRGGALLETQNAFAPGDLLNFAMSIQNELVKLQGKIVYCRQRDKNKFQSGIRFLKTSLGDYQTLSGYVLGCMQKQQCQFAETGARGFASCN